MLTTILLFSMTAFYIINFKQLHIGWYDPIILLVSGIISLLMGGIGKIINSSFTKSYLIAYIINCELSFYINNFKWYFMTCCIINVMINYLLYYLKL